MLDTTQTRLANLDKMMVELQSKYVDSGKLPGLSMHVGFKGREIW